MGMTGTCLGAAYESMPYLCDKEDERRGAETLLNQGGTAGIPVPMGTEFRRFMLFIIYELNKKERFRNGEG